MISGDGMKPINTFAAMNPLGSQLDMSVLNEFIDQQNKILEILDSSRDVNLNKIRTAISISKLIKLRVADTLRVVIYHNQRHFQQVKRALVLKLS